MRGKFTINKNNDGYYIEFIIKNNGLCKSVYDSDSGISDMVLELSLKEYKNILRKQYSGQFKHDRTYFKNKEQAEEAKKWLLSMETMMKLEK
jgi:hypothetical protein